MSETQLGRDIRLELGSGSTTRLMRNNVGVLKNDRGDYIAFGLCPGSSDLIGIHSVTVTPDMVGRKIGLFVAIETKTAAGFKRMKKNRESSHQDKFVRMVRNMGGLAGFAISREEARQILNLSDNQDTLTP